MDREEYATHGVDLDAARPRLIDHLALMRVLWSAIDDISIWADGWLPIEGYGDVVGRIPQLRATLERHDRDPDTATVSVYSSQGDPGLIDRYRQAGVDRVVLWLPPADESTVISSLDQHARQLAEHLT